MTSGAAGVGLLAGIAGGFPHEPQSTSPVPVPATLLLLGVLSAVVYAVRLVRVLRLYPAANHRLTLLLLAPLLPRREAILWVPELEQQFATLSPATRKELTTDVIRSLPSLLGTTWAVSAVTKIDPLHGAVERVVLSAVRWRLGPVDVAFQSPAPIWPTDERRWYRLKARCSTLRRNAWLLDHFVSERRHPELVSRAKWLKDRCRDFLEEQTQLRPAAPYRRCTAHEAALLLEIGHTTSTVHELIVRALARGGG
ncbi:hypothetical protein IOD16_02295 [Saccharothrix sp. 6-C]|uniref:hypothetical protein n=1 Tax=Saccharothrix sp. 6-C TaxID=2781735 RepID=UPI001916E149|nr:hypothetical protein [Saccharothrix sp. 6-C]QQQ77394.1 hypothetical protein IOD16_02295 [Saccharothrix sp. 6-C]